MNRKKLAVLEDAFLADYPEGFESEDMKAVAKKHKMDKMKAFVDEHFAPEAFEDKGAVYDSFVKLISRSSLVSVFEKAKFRDISKGLSLEERTLLVQGIQDFLYGDQATGFSIMVDVLSQYKIAKWPILTVLGVYMHPDKEVLVKPTTVKGILKYFEVDAFQYTSKANYTFYDQYRHFINDIKQEVSQQLQVNNAAFCGFLMMGIQPKK